MPIDDELIRRLRALFAVEAEEHLQTINQDLLALEQQPDAPRSQELLADIFRAAHTLKGSARSVDLENVGLLAHRMETLFGQMRSAGQRAAPEVFDLIYECLDAIGLLVRAGGDSTLPPVDVNGLSERLAAAAAQTPESAPAAPPAEPAAEAAQSMVRYPPAAEPPAKGEPPGTGAAGATGLDLSTGSPRMEPTVRIATAKLDALMAQLNELQVNRISADERVVELRGLLAEVEAWEGEWRKLRTPYRRLSTSPEAGVTGGDRRDVDELLEFLQDNERRLRLARARLSDLLRAMRADNYQLAQVAGDLQDDVRRTRMTSVSVVFDAFPRMVRDLAHELNKEVTLEISGAETELDRTLLEQIKAPLLHLLRNAVDHGIEVPEARLRAGKPRGGRIRLAAAQHGNTIRVEVADDGAGIDPARVKAGALKRDLISAEAAAAMSDQDALWLIFRSGLSTRALITDVSGRGVGLDVVRENVERLQGLINVESHLGRGTRFTLQLPLTIATTLCLLAEAAGQTFALPVAYMTRLMHVRPAEIGRAQGRETVAFEGRPIVLEPLAELLGRPAAPSVPEPPPAAPPAARQASAESSTRGRALSEISARPPVRKFPVVVLGSGERLAAVRVDALVGTQELVVKPLPHPFVRVPNVAGAAILGNGTVVVVLHAADLLRGAGRASGRAAALPAPATTAPARATVLIADDSITTRTLEKNILEAAGYDVHAAADGLEAWQWLQSRTCDLLVSDVQMPRLDGFELTQQIRADERLRQLPVILVTALASREDRERGIKAGADAYIVKSAFDQDTLLSTIRQLI